MIGLGTILNVITVLIGSSLGMLIGNRLPEKVQQTIIASLGLITIIMGVDMGLDTQNILIPMGALLIGGMIGEWIDIDRALQRFAAWLEARFAGNSAEGEARLAATQRFIKGFITSSLIFCVGPLTILGSISDGMGEGYQMLAIKSVLDGFAALAFASSLGLGVMFSVITVAVFQGLLTLFAGQVSVLLTEAMRIEMFATGGIMLIGLAISGLLEIKPIRIANLLPALIIAPLIVAILTALGLPVAPEF